MEERNKTVSLDDIVTATTNGVLRAMESRNIGSGVGVSASDLIRSGFRVDIRIIAGGPPVPFFFNRGNVGFDVQGDAGGTGEEGA
ncbi:MAG TPA: hypothetical protein VGO69_04585 [Pyrinomonadaceae bacterium]|jgi:hypothetical protein|nr:hypothetical protein [Pyrinomonadaceae bacterium]